MTDDLNNGSLNSFKERLEETERLAKNPTPENLLVLTKMAEYDELSDIRFFARKLLGICRRRMKQGIKESGGGEAEDKVLSEFFKFNKNLADDERQSAVIRIINNKNDFLGAVSGTKGQSAEKVAVRLLAVLNRYLVLHLKGTVLLSDETLATLIKAFGKYGGAGEIEKILPFLDHENSRVQANAIEALENIGDVRESAIKALENIGDVRANVINHIFSKLDNKDPRVRANAVIALKKFGGINSIKVIKKMIESGTASMSASAAYALRFFPAAENLYLVESLLKKQDANVRANAAAALVKFVGHGVEGAADLMKKNNITGEAPPADIEDIEAEIRSNEAAVEKLNEGLRSPDRERRIDAIKNAVSNNCYGIGEILLEALKKESDAHVIATIIIRLGFMEYKPAVNTIKEFLKSADDRIRANAVEAIGRFGPSSSGRLKELRSFIDDPCCRVRANAIVALKKEKIAGVYPSLLQMINPAMKPWPPN